MSCRHRIQITAGVSHFWCTVEFLHSNVNFYTHILHFEFTASVI